MMETDMNDYGPDILTNFICEEIKKERPDDQPFFLMYTMNLAHSAHCVTPYEVAAGASPDNTHIEKGHLKVLRYLKARYVTWMH